MRDKTEEEKPENWARISKDKDRLFDL